MTIHFGPRLIGATEKTLNAILRLCLSGHGITEAEWVALRLAQIEADQHHDAEGLAGAIAAAAHFTDAPGLVDGLTRRGLLEEGRLSEQGMATIGAIQRRIQELEGPAEVWTGLAPSDVAATERVLNQVLERARALLASQRPE